MQFLGVTATTDVVNLLERNRLVKCLVDSNQLNMLTIYVSTIEFKICILGKKIAKPVLQLLLTFLFKLKTYFSTNNLM